MTLAPVEHVTVALPKGESDVSVSVAVPEKATASLILAHGAGAGKDHPFMTGFTDALNALGIATARFNFPYVEAGRRMPGPAAHAIATWRAIVSEVAGDGPVWLAGKSYGGRMASMAVAEGMTASGLVYLGYPLHAPGKPEAPRGEHLASIEVPQLFLSGTKDAFVDPHEQFERVLAGCQNATLHWVEGGGHSFEVAGNKREADVIGAELAPIVAGFMQRNA